MIRCGLYCQVAYLWSFETYNPFYDPVAKNKDLFRDNSNNNIDNYMFLKENQETHSIPLNSAAPAGRNSFNYTAVSKPRTGPRGPKNERCGQTGVPSSVRPRLQTVYPPAAGGPELGQTEP